MVRTARDLRAVRQGLLRAACGVRRGRGIRCTGPEKREQIADREKRGSRGGRPPESDEDVCEQRRVVERGTDRPKRNRATAARCDRLAVRCETTVLVAAIGEWP
ncbi:hypothetical protein ACFWJ4_22370 [Kitasatospora sp. NPDC127067]|uniref:hypothetical protein n=1 Tax=Kitasatospora sp. NPDC127067 TaxID=3347126 RepID=UPI00364F2F9C